MTDFSGAEPHPEDDSGGFCCVAAGMHMGHDEDCPNWKCPDCGGLGYLTYETGVVSPEGVHEYAKEPCDGCTQPCPECRGAGGFRNVQTGEVTRDMALDACEPSMEGQPIFEDIPCSFCNGGGLVRKRVAEDMEEDNV